MAVFDADVAGVIGHITGREPRPAIAVAQAGHAGVIGCIAHLRGAVGVDAAVAAGARLDLADARIAMLVGGAVDAAISIAVTALRTGTIVVLHAGHARAGRVADPVRAVAVGQAFHAGPRLRIAAARAAFCVKNAFHAAALGLQAAPVGAMHILLAFDAGVVHAQAHGAATMRVDTAFDTGPIGAADAIGTLVVAIAVNAGHLDADPLAGTFLVDQTASALIAQTGRFAGAVVIAQAVDAGAFDRAASAVAPIVFEAADADGALGVTGPVRTVGRIDAAHALAGLGMATVFAAIFIAQAACAGPGVGIATLAGTTIAIASALHTRPPHGIAERVLAVVGAQTFDAFGRVGGAAPIGAIAVAQALHARAPRGIADALGAGILPVAGRTLASRRANQAFGTLRIEGAVDAAPLGFQASVAGAIIVAQALLAQARGLANRGGFAVFIARAPRHAIQPGCITDFSVSTGQIGAKHAFGAALALGHAAALNATRPVFAGAVRTRR